MGRARDGWWRRGHIRTEQARREWAEALQRSPVAYTAAWVSTSHVVSPSLREFLR